MKTMKIFPVILIILITGSFISCGNGGVSAEEAREILSELVYKAEELNEIYWGKGIEPGETVEVLSKSTPKYVKVSPQSKYRDINSLKIATESVFTEEFCRIIFEMAFFGSEEIIARYNESDDGVLMVNVNDEGYALQTKLFPEKAEIKSQYGGRLTLMVPAEFGGKPYEDIKIVLIKENGVWLIDSPTY